MIKIILPIFLGGFLIGYLLRKKASLKKGLGFFIAIAVYLLLFSLGLSIGANQNLLSQIPSLGLIAIYLTLGAVVGSILCAFLLENTGKKTDKSPILSLEKNKISLWENLRESLGILIVFALGVCLSFSQIFPSFSQAGDLSVYFLYLLMGLVGVQMGSTQGLREKLKNQPKRYLFLPLATIVGTLLGVAFVSIFLCEYSLANCLAIGSGLAYYSLSSIIIGESIGPEWGSVALMSNILRELMALTLAPFIVKISRLSLISTGGATTMDTTLPVNTRYCGPSYAALSAYHGFTTDLSVPFLVSFFCLW